MADRRGGDRPTVRGPPARARPDPDVVHRQERRLRARVRASRDLRARARRTVRVHAAAVRILPRADLLDLRPRVVVGRFRADSRRDGHGVPRLCDRCARALARGGHVRRRRRHAEPVPRLARRAPQPRDPGSAPPRGTRPVCAPRRRSAFVALVDRGRRLCGARDPRQRPHGSSCRSCSRSTCWSASVGAGPPSR